MRFPRIILACATLIAATAGPAHATFHFMQIEQVMGGVDGNTEAQAIQLRMRNSFQNAVSQGRLVAYDATGANPVVLLALPNDVATGVTGARVLITTAAFNLMVNPAVTPDFTMTNRIPDSYLAAGSLTWESAAFGTIYWRVSWGGASYTGSGSGTTNDADGNFNPPFAGPLPSGNDQALLFSGAANALSTNNAAQYALTTGSAVFTNNANQSGTSVGVAMGHAPAAIALSAPAPNPVRGPMLYRVDLPRQAHVLVRVMDVSGRVVRTLMDRTLGPGRHEFSWNAIGAGGAPLASGLYLLELRSGAGATSRRFVVLR